MAVIQQRGSKWQCRVRRKGFPAVAKSFSTKEDALKWSRIVERQMDVGEYSPVGLETIADLIDRYQQEVTPTKKGSKQEIYRLAVLKADKLAKMSVKAVAPIDVAAFRDRRLKAVKPVTVLHDLCTLSAVFEHARLEWSLPFANPVRGIRKPTAGKGRDRRLQDGEYDALLTQLKSA